MPELPETYWNKLTMEEKIDFFDFYMDMKFNRDGMVPCDYCPDPLYNKSLLLDDYDGRNIARPRHERCEKLFGYKGMGYGYRDCPCSKYGEVAFLALEKALQDAGWIEKDA